MVKVPGWYLWIDGAETQISAANKAHCNKVLYGENKPISFYKSSFTVFIKNCKDHYESENIDYSAWTISEWRYFYNRQLIFQMTKNPVKNTHPTRQLDRYQTLMLDRSPGGELQLDTFHYQDPYTNDVRKYLVITEIFSRFVWFASIRLVRNADNVRVVTSANVLRAFQEAMQRGDANYVGRMFYEHLRPKHIVLRMDNGTEFQGDFLPERDANNPGGYTKQGYLEIFPNAVVQYSTPKNLTFNRPSQTGPVEATIRMLRKVIFDYTATLNENFYSNEGMQTILNTYNGLKQLETLNNNSPTNIATAIIDGDNNLIQSIKYKHDRLAQKRRDDVDQMDLYWEGRNNGAMDALGNIPGVGFRLYIRPGFFDKEVSIRVSFPVCRITWSNNYLVNLEEIVHDPTFRPRLYNRIPWKALCAVKIPIDDGPQYPPSSLHVNGYDLGRQIRNYLIGRQDWPERGRPNDDELAFLARQQNHNAAQARQNRQQNRNIQIIASQPVQIQPPPAPQNAGLHLLANVAQLPAAQNSNPLDFLANVVALQPALPIPPAALPIPQPPQPPPRVSGRNRAPRAYNGNDPYRRVYPGGNG